MSQIPANCPSCTFDFYVPNAFEFAGEGSVNLSMQGNKVVCPKCGQWADMIDGEFRLSRVAIELLSGPKASFEVLKRLQDVAVKLQSSDITKEKAIQEAGDIDPAFGQLIERVFSHGIAAITLLIAIIALYIQIDAEIEDETLKEQTRFELKRQTELLEKLVEQGSQANDKGQVKRRKTKSAKPKAKINRSGERVRSNRRADVKKQRRQKLKAKRIESGKRIPTPKFRPNND